MAERKVLIKYYPPDFDPTKLIKNKRPLDKQDNVRMMVPMTVRCNTCGNYLYIGTKFNMRKETVLNENYLGIRIYRFYFKCTHCYTEITFKTDPKNHDYVVEFGATRNYEPSRDNEKAVEVLKKLRESDEEGNAMKVLENLTADSKRQLEIQDALDEILYNSKKMIYITPEELIKLTISNQIDQEVFEELDKEEQNKLDEFLSYQRIKRITEDDDISSNQSIPEVTFFSKKQNASRKQNLKPVIKKIRKVSETDTNPLKDNELKEQSQSENTQGNNNPLTLLQSYSSESD